MTHPFPLKETLQILLVSWTVILSIGVNCEAIPPLSPLRKLMSKDMFSFP